MRKSNSRSISRLFCCIFAGAGIVHSLSAVLPYPPVIEGAQVETYKIAGDMDMRMWIFNPEGHSAESETPAIVLFFGGGWTNGSPMHFARQGQYLAKRGMVAILVDYRVKSRNGVPVKVCVEDAKSAIRWVRANADRLGIDPDRIAAGGGSAGGHLAAATAAVPGFDNPDEDLSISSRPNALVLFNPVAVVGPVEGVPELDMLKNKHNRKRAGTDPANLSPYHQAGPDMPPTIIFHGTNDKTVPFIAAELFARKLKDFGVRCELVAYEGQEHSFFNEGEFFVDTLRRADAFLVSIGYLTASPAPQ